MKNLEENDSCLPETIEYLRTVNKEYVPTTRPELREAVSTAVMLLETLEMDDLKTLQLIGHFKNIGEKEDVEKLELAIIKAVATLDQSDGSRVHLIEAIDNARRTLSDVMPKNFDDLVDDKIRETRN